MKKYITYLSVISAFAVVMLHTNHVYGNFSYDSYWTSATVIEGLFYFAVPVFFMISGVTIIGYSKRYSTAQYFEKRVNRAVIPFIVWCVIAKIFTNYYDNSLTVTLQFSVTWWLLSLVIGVLYYAGKKLSFNPYILLILKTTMALMFAISVLKTIDINTQNVFDIISNISLSKYWPEFWFFPALFSVYLTTPALEAIPENARQRVFQWFILGSFIFSALLPFVTDFIPDWHYNWELSTPFKSYAWWVIVGYYIDRYGLSKKNNGT